MTTAELSVLSDGVSITEAETYMSDCIRETLDHKDQIIKAPSYEVEIVSKANIAV